MMANIEGIDMARKATRTRGPKKGSKWGLLPDQVSIRFEAGVLGRMKALVPVFQAESTLRQGRPWSLAKVLRFALDEGLDAVERRYGRKA